MPVSRREVLGWGAVGVGSALLSSAASSNGLSAFTFRTPQGPVDPLAPLPAAPVSVPSAPGGIDAQLFQKAKAALDARPWIRHRDFIGVVDFSQPSRDPRFHVIHLPSGHVESHAVAHGSGSDPAHSGYLERFSNVPGSEATSNGAYMTADTYHGKYGLSMKLQGLDWTNSNAMSRAIVIHNAWYAEPEMIEVHGKLGRSQGCFAFSRKSQFEVMHRLGGGRMIFADKVHTA